MRAAFPSFLSVDPIDADLLGAPLFPGRHLDKMLENKVVALSRASARLSKLQAHDSLLILKNALCAPKLMYTLRTSPFWGNQALEEFDNTLRSSLSLITNCFRSDSA